MQDNLKCPRGTPVTSSKLEGCSKCALSTHVITGLPTRAKDAKQDRLNEETGSTRREDFAGSLGAYQSDPSLFNDRFRHDPNWVQRPDRR